MKVLDAGTDQLSNAEVLEWMKAKRQQHIEEDAEDRAAGVKVMPRPENFLKALKKHTAHLESDNYPYKKNPKTYDDPESMQKFDDMLIKTIINPIQDKHQASGMSEEELDKVMDEVTEEKGLKETELIMVYNHAPQCVEMLAPMIENIEDRFTEEEQQLIVDAIVAVLRREENEGVAEKPKAAVAEGGVVVDESADVADESGDVVGGEEERSEKEMSPFSARAALSGFSGLSLAPAAGAAPAPISLPVRSRWAVLAQQTGGNAEEIGSGRKER